MARKEDKYTRSTDRHRTRRKRAPSDQRSRLDRDNIDADDGQWGRETVRRDSWGALDVLLTRARRGKGVPSC